MQQGLGSSGEVGVRFAVVLWGEPSDRLRSVLDCRVLSYAEVLAQVNTDSVLLPPTATCPPVPCGALSRLGDCPGQVWRPCAGALPPLQRQSASALVRELGADLESEGAWGSTQH
jgi:hypothetical protein